MKKLFALLVVAVLAAGACSADPDAQAGREIAGKQSDAVITVQYVLQTTASYGGESETSESKDEATGTIIDPSGLVVMSLSTTTADEESYMPEEYQVTSNVTDVKLILGDGQELPARIVLRDKDLDLAFVRPIAQVEKALPYVDLANSSSPELFEKTFTLTRLGAIANRCAAGSLGRVLAIVEKPRTLYVPEGTGDYGADLGSPVFTLDSKVVGIMVSRSAPPGGESGYDWGMYIVLPGSDVLEVAKQAPK
ncbi:MAG: S1 family peptidase [Armatimonadota bacterium]